jgi:hypothetical protein
MKSLLGLSLVVLVFIAAGVGGVAADGHAHLGGGTTGVLTSALPAVGLPEASPPAKGTPAGGQLHVCSQGGAITGGSLRRLVAFPSDHLHFSFPARERIGTAAEARRVARVICALPRVSPGTYSCPADLGVSYVLELRSASALARLSIDPWGCEWVTGPIATRWSRNSLWRTLGQAIGRHHATRVSFAGTLPAS